MAILVISTFWLLWMMLPWTFMYKFLCKHIFSIPLGIYLKTRIIGSSGNIMCNLNNYKTIFQRGHTILYSTNHAEEFKFLHLLTNTFWYFWLWVFSVFKNDIVHFLIWVAKRGNVQREDKKTKSWALSLRRSEKRSSKLKEMKKNYQWGGSMLYPENRVKKVYKGRSDGQFYQMLLRSKIRTENDY